MLRCFVLIIAIVVPACALTTPLSADSPTDRRPFSASIGFDGYFKLGSWTPIFFHCSAGLEPASFVAVAADGNGLPVTFRGPVISGGEGEFQGWLKIGRADGSIQLELLGNHRQSLGTVNLQIGEDGETTAVDATTPMVLTIESGTVVRDSIEAIELQLFEQKCRAIAVDKSVDLPLTWQAYQGLRVIYWTTSSAELVAAISEQQLAAIENWVNRGGKLVLAVGKNGDLLFDDPKGIARFLPGKFAGTLPLKSSSQIELYASSKQRLLLPDDEPLTATKILPMAGAVAEPKNSTAPLVIRKPLGFGQVVLATIDIDVAPLAAWSGQKNLLLKMTLPGLNLNRTASTENESRSFVRMGYRDLIGQLMLPLENFSRVRFVNFTLVAVLIALFILCVGPGDYFLLRRLVGKMEWTWVTFSLMAIGFCGLAMLIARSTKPREMQINQLEIIDIDAVSLSIRGSIWTNIYSPSNTRVDVSPALTNRLGIATGRCSISWLGLPGDGLGAMRARTPTGLFLTGYECIMDVELSDNDFRSRLESIPIRVSSTKPVFSQYWSESTFAINSRLQMNTARNRLSGTVTNPLDVELQNCRLLFENWSYILNRPLGPGETIDIGSEMKERTAAFYFSRREESESDTGGGRPWDPQDDNLDRVAEMLMFHDAAGGRQYTGMTHGFQTYAELSEPVIVHRAILFGSIQGVCTQLKIEGGSGDVAYDYASTWVRIVLPVEYK